MNFAAPRITILAASVRRFPLPALAALLFAATAIAGIHDWMREDVWSENLIFGGGAGFLGLLAVALIGEAKGWSPVKTLIASAIAIALYLGWLFLVGTRLGLPHVLLAVSFLGLCVTTPLAAKADDNSLWQFNQKSFSGYFIAGLATWLIYAGIFGITYALTELFDIKRPDKFIGDSMIIAASIFWPLYTLSFVPKLPMEKVEDPRYPGPFAFVLSWVALPILLVYGTIILVYGFQVMMLGRPPIASVSWLVMGFAAPGILLRFMLYPMREQGTWLVRMFHRYFFLILLPMLALLFWAVIIRLSAYGITEMRYLALMGGVWAGAVALWGLLAESRFRLWHAPAALTVLLMLATVGPWSAESVAYKSQTQRFETVLRQLNILKPDGTFQAATGDVSFDARSDLSSILDFIANRRDKQKPALLIAAEKATHKEGASALMTAWNVPYVNSWERRRNGERNNDYIYFNAGDFQQSSTPLAIGGFDQLLPISLYDYANGKEPTKKNWDNIPLTLTFDESVLTLAINGVEQKLELLPLFPQPLDKQNGNLGTAHLEKELVWADGSRARVIITTASLNKREGPWRAQNFSGYVLLDTP